MKFRSSLVVLALAASAGATSTQAGAQVLRWATQGDAQTMDPQSQNESLTNQMNQQVYETLVDRD
jgi:peptide/nickel transport system substrate-binding protein